MLDLFRPRLIVSSKVSQAIFVHLIYNSAKLYRLKSRDQLFIQAKNRVIAERLYRVSLRRSYVYWTVHRCDSWRIKAQPDIRVSVLQAGACNTDTTPTQPHRNSNTHRTKNNTTNVAIQQNSRKLLMMDILVSETCWARKKWNKVVSDIKLVFHSSIKEFYWSWFVFYWVGLLVNIYWIYGIYGNGSWSLCRRRLHSSLAPPSSYSQDLWCLPLDDVLPPPS